ncbi:MAG TPA: uroporphyrinogen-III C-methyltransferase [Woeseiaceae bacterium]|nr:uroporphyrinogen-III C-methyltransferase [Woeseiaceae bacterium]
MTERTDEEQIGPERPEPEPAAQQDLEAEPAGVDVAAETAPTPSVRKPSFAAALASLALLFALAAAAGVGYLAWTGRNEGEAAASNRAAIGALTDDLDNTRETTEDLRGRIGELDSANEDQGGRIDGLDDRLDRFTAEHESIPGRLAGLERTVSSLAGISSDTRDAWLLAEAEYYMQIANAELELAGNPDRALNALEFADERIRELADPALTEVRRALAGELRALESMEKPDLAGLSMTLASLAKNVESMPLRQDAIRRAERRPTPSADGAGALDRAIASVRSAFSHMVSVRRTDEAIKPLLPPEAEYFLRANLALELQSARLALLRGEQTIYEQSLNEASAWLRRYYDADSRAVRSALESLATARDADWTAAPPDISTSLRRLREYRERREAESRKAPAGEPGQ